MGCNFLFVNRTTHTDAIPSTNLLLYRNIDRGTKQHLRAVFMRIICDNGWNLTDTVEAECCCHKYRYANGVFTDVYYNEAMNQNDGCAIPFCSICRSA